VLAAEIDQRLPGTNVRGESGAVDLTPDATVAVNIARFDVDDDGAVVLAAQMAWLSSPAAAGICHPV
jgi:hypothetical protein